MEQTYELVGFTRNQIPCVGEDYIYITIVVNLLAFCLETFCLGICRRPKAILPFQILMVLFGAPALETELLLECLKKKKKIGAFFKV
jgi:hypothetical protein